MPSTFEPECPLHGYMEIEDRDSSYGQELWLCNQYPLCQEEAHVGPSDIEIYRKEHR